MYKFLIQYLLYFVCCVLFQMLHLLLFLARNNYKKYLSRRLKMSRVLSESLLIKEFDIMREEIKECPINDYRIGYLQALINIQNSIGSFAITYGDKENIR